MTEPAETEHLAQVLVLPARASLLERQDELEAEGHVPGAAA